MDRPGQARIAQLRLPPSPQAGAPCVVGYSGGLDSTVLLHLLAGDPATRRAGLRALHVHHGLHAQADAWALHCEATCAGLGIPLEVVRVAVDRRAGLGLEGAAREARHAAFAAHLRAGEVLALAHHRDDQAETFLLRALRGSGVDGLAAMRPWRAYASGWLWRPLLGMPRADLLAHARSQRLDWIDDPGNDDPGLDRNFLRHHVMPHLQARWPHAPAALARSAGLAAAATDLLDAGDDAALAGVRRAVDLLDVAGLLALPATQRARVLRRWIAALGLPPLPAHGSACIEADLLDARPDARARFDWHGARVQRWRDLLHAGPLRAPLSRDWRATWDGRAPLRLPTGDTLELLGADGFDREVIAHARHGGERLRLPRRRHDHALKHLLQDAGVPPWQRERLPLLSAADGTLLAAGDRLCSATLASWLDARGARLQWTAVA